MAKITFYRQARADGGVRTGISVGDVVVLDGFEGERGDDPSLRWFVDVRCEGKLPADPEDVRQWLLEHKSVVKKGLEKLAERLHGGVDVDLWPILEKVKDAPKGIRITIACSAIRREEALGIAKVLKDIGKRWKHYLNSLSALEPAQR